MVANLRKKVGSKALKKSIQKKIIRYANEYSFGGMKMAEEANFSGYRCRKSVFFSWDG